MFLPTFICIVIFAPLILARPQQQQQQQPQQQQAFSPDGSTPIPIVSHSEIVGENGNFNFSYETGNGIRYEQSGYTKIVPNLASRVGADPDADPNGAVQVLSGSYSYAAPDGTQINLSYIADENGYQPVGDHLPTPPPIPEEIQKVLASLPQAQNAADAPQQPGTFIANNPNQ